MDWKSSIRGFKAYLKLERGLSDNSLESYIRDVRKLVEFLEIKEKTVSPLQIQSRDVEEFLGYIHEIGLGARTQARMLSGIKAFYKYLLVEDLLDDDPTGLIEGPKLSRKIPDVLSLEEINALLGVQSRWPCHSAPACP